MIWSGARVDSLDAGAPPQVPLYGDAYAPRAERAPVVVLFHTAAGPRDLFVQWHAEVLRARGYGVFVADLFGDARGDGPETGADERVVAATPRPRRAERPLATPPRT